MDGTVTAQVIVVPVPLHRWRLFARRYNQAAEIARPLARGQGLAFLPDALERVRRFGQNDHVRMYARVDFTSRMAQAGLKVCCFDQSQFPDDRFELIGLTSTSCLYVGEKSL